jgi:hypothetical protein
MFHHLRQKMSILLVLVVFGNFLPVSANLSSRSQIYIPFINSDSADGFYEDMSQRTVDTQIFIKRENDREQTMYRRFLEPVFYKDSKAGVWKDIDNDLTFDQGTQRYRNTAGPFTASFATPTNLFSADTPKSLLSIQNDTPYTVDIQLTSGSVTQPVINGSTITYPNVTTDQDITYMVHGGGVKEEVVLHSASAAATTRLSIAAKGLRPRLNSDNSWDLVDASNVVRWHIPEAVGYDAKGIEAPVSLDFISGPNSTYTAVLAVDPAWLSSSQRTFPVRLDPSIVLPNYFAGETFVEKAYPDIVLYNTRARYVGYSTHDGVNAKHETRIFTPVNLSFLPTGSQGSDIQSVALVMTQYVSEAWPAGFATSVYPVQSAWDAASIRWSNQPATGPAIASGVHVTADMGAKKWDITNWSRQVLDNATVNNGLMLSADDETRGGGIFHSSQCSVPDQCQASRKPYLEVLINSMLTYGDGKDGDLVVPSGSTKIINETSTGITAEGEQAMVTDSSGFTVGDYVYLHQTQGSVHTGRGELNQIKSIVATTWTFSSTLIYTYTNTLGKAQAIKVPRFHNVTVEANGTLTAPEWNGVKGGILFFLADGTTVVNGIVTMDGKGFKGGYGNDHPSSPCAGQNQGQQGHAPSGGAGCVQQSSYGSGGGGAHGSGDPHWGAGGGAGYGTAGAAGAGPNPGNGGVVFGSADLTKIYLGPGGGGGSWGTNPYGGGRSSIEGNDFSGQGGGILIAQSKTISGFNASAAGNKGGNSANVGYGGYAGGGGAGGSIKLVSNDITFNAITISGGAGGDGTKGAGGQGGNGRARIEYCNTANPSVLPPLSIQRINCAGLPVNSGLDPLLDTYSFENEAGLPTFAQFVEEFGTPRITYVITETALRQIISDTAQLPLNIANTTLGISVTMPLTITEGITSTDSVSGTLIPRPIEYLFEEIVYKAVYADEYVQAYNAALKAGLCAGMVATVASFIAELDDPTEYGGVGTVRSIPKTEKIMKFIQVFHGRQISAAVLNWLAQNGKIGVSEYFNYLLATMGTAAWKENPEIIGLVKAMNCDQNDIEIGHALLPYRVELLSENTGRIYVYDPNYVDSQANAHYIEVNLEANTWSYALLPNPIPANEVRWTGNGFYITPLSAYQEEPELPTDANSIVAVDGVNPRSFVGGDKEHLGHQNNNIEAGDGSHTGCTQTGSTLQFVQEISSTHKLTPLNGFSENSLVPNLFAAPAGQPWKLNGLGSRSAGIGDLMVFGPDSLAGAIGAAQTSTRDSLRVDETMKSIAFQTSDPAKPMTMFQMQETDLWTRVYAIGDIEIGAGEIVSETVSADLESVEIINDSQVQKEFNLGLTVVGSPYIGGRMMPAVIGAHERRIYHPIWDEVATAPVLIEIDRGNDGTIDQVEFLGGAMLPVVTSSATVPSARGTEFTLMNQQQHTIHGYIGWTHLDYTLAPDQDPTNAMHGTNNDIERWLKTPQAPTVWAKGKIVGIPGTHGSLFHALGSLTPGAEDLYHVGDIMLVPTFGAVIDERGGAPAYYQINGFAVVRIVSSSNAGGDDDKCTLDCKKSITATLLLATSYK